MRPNSGGQIFLFFCCQIWQFERNLNTGFLSYFLSFLHRLVLVRHMICRISYVRSLFKTKNSERIFTNTESVLLLNFVRPGFWIPRLKRSSAKASPTKILWFTLRGTTYILYGPCIPYAVNAMLCTTAMSTWMKSCPFTIFANFKKAYRRSLVDFFIFSVYFLPRKKLEKSANQFYPLGWVHKVLMMVRISRCWSQQ